MEKRILIVDDSKDIVDTLKVRLNSDHYIADGALSGEECLKMAGKADYDLIIMDINMPDMDGIATSCRLQREEKTRMVPIIFLTALVERKEYDGPYGVIGTHAVIAKPFDYKDLLQLVRDKIG